MTRRAGGRERQGGGEGGSPSKGGWRRLHAVQNVAPSRRQDTEDKDENEDDGDEDEEGGRGRRGGG